jgi:hypothetical protein
MSEILATCKVKDANGWWLILECGHWYKWTGAVAPPIGDDIDCPSDTKITVKKGTV